MTGNDDWVLRSLVTLPGNNESHHRRVRQACVACIKYLEQILWYVYHNVVGVLVSAQ